jgi:hypothetical protein
MLLGQLCDDIRTEVARDLPNFRAREAEFAQIDTGEFLELEVPTCPPASTGRHVFG